MLRSVAVRHLKAYSCVISLFQLKSCVRCLQCSHVSVRFDPYTFLSLPIPMDNSIYVECIGEFDLFKSYLRLHLVSLKE